MRAIRGGHWVSCDESDSAETPGAGTPLASLSPSALTDQEEVGGAEVAPYPAFPRITLQSPAPSGGVRPAPK